MRGRAEQSQESVLWAQKEAEMADPREQPGMNDEGGGRHRGAPFLTMTGVVLLLFALLYAIGTLGGWG